MMKTGERRRGDPVDSVVHSNNTTAAGTLIPLLLMRKGEKKTVCIVKRVAVEKRKGKEGFRSWLMDSLCSANVCRCVASVESDASPFIYEIIFRFLVLFVFSTLPSSFSWWRHFRAGTSEQQGAGGYRVVLWREHSSCTGIGNGQAEIIEMKWPGADIL